MIVPTSLSGSAFDKATYDELVAAYLADGFTRESAEAYAYVATHADEIEAAGGIVD